MALQLNLLHEEITQERQRKRDPLKLGIIALSCFGALLFLYYGWNAYRTIQIKGQLNAAEREWQKVEPKVTAAQKRATELHQIIDSTKVLDGLIEDRFYWAPFLASGFPLRRAQSADDQPRWQHCRGATTRSPSRSKASPPPANRAPPPKNSGNF